MLLRFLSGVLLGFRGFGLVLGSGVPSRGPSAGLRTLSLRLDWAGHLTDSRGACRGKLARDASSSDDVGAPP